MKLSGIISISGKPGLYTVVGQSKSNVIVESVIDGKRFPAFASNRISALEDISIYTYDDDVLLSEVFDAIYDKLAGEKAPSHKDSIETLSSLLREVLPEYDEEQVFPSDIKKLFQWYNILDNAGKLVKEDAEEPTEVTEEVSTDEEE